jgi:hypothetical protein
MLRIALWGAGNVVNSRNVMRHFFAPNLSSQAPSVAPEIFEFYGNRGLDKEKNKQYILKAHRRRVIVITMPDKMSGAPGVLSGIFLEECL